jgi:hypothetical protein
MGTTCGTRVAQQSVMTHTHSLLTILLGVASAALIGACAEAPERSGSLTPLTNGQGDVPGSYRPYG